MDLSFHKIKNDESHNAIRFEFASPEERQDYTKAVVPDIPAGYIYAVREETVTHTDTRRGTSTKRRAITLGLVKVGESLVLEGDETGSPTSIAPTKPAKLDIPDVVLNADAGARETMAGRNGVIDGKRVTVQTWRSWSEAKQRAALAEAMRRQNAA